jgi:glutamate dehydrogenase
MAKHFALTRERPGDTPKVAVRPPQQRGHLAALQTVVPDMPFLVDSLSQRVRETGAGIDWLVHPILRLSRDAKGQLQGVTEQGAPESLIHLEFEPLADAGYARLETAVRETLADVRTAVADYPAMRVALRALAAALAVVPQGGRAEEFAEARDFLEWLDEQHFTFLGLMENRAQTGSGSLTLHPDEGSGLGLLRAGSPLAQADALIAPQEELDKYAGSSRLLVITKGNVRSTVHHAEYLDVISIKRFAADGQLLGTVRLVGLFTAETYQARPTEIPIVRRKVSEVLARSGLSEDSHGGKNLREILQTWPRDELFQSGEDELFAASLAVRALRDRHQLKQIGRASCRERVS